MKSLSPVLAGSFCSAVRFCGSRTALLLAAICVLFAASAFAQEATIVGTVTDPTGASVPNAAITITNTHTGVARNLPSSAHGQYVAPTFHTRPYPVHSPPPAFTRPRHKETVST